MAGTSLFFDIMARDHASAVFNKVGAAADQLGRRTDKAAKSHGTFGKAVRWAGGMLSAYGVGQYLKSSVQEYAAAEAAQNKLAISYQRFPKMQNATLQSFKDLNTQLMLHTGFDDDDTAAMQANLARFDLTGQKIQRLTPLVADLAQVQGTDMVTAGGKLGKAMLGNTRALKDLGISYTATGNKAKDMRNVVRLLNDKIGGESARAADTTAVKMRKLGAHWGELKETVGQAVLPAFSKLVDVAGPAITDLAQVVDRNMPQIEQTFEDVWTAASKLGRLGKNIWDGFSSMPEGTRQLLLALAGGTWAVGKIKGSALGSGIGSIFSGLKTITAGNVTVVGKTVTTGTPGAGGGATGGLFSKAAAGSAPAAAGLAGILLAFNSAIILGLNAAIKANWKNTAAWQRDVQEGNKPRAGADSRGKGFSTSTDGGIRQPNLPNNSGRLRAEASGFREASKAAKDHGDTVKRLTGVDTAWGNAAKSASLKGTLGAKAFSGAVKSIPDKKHTRISADGADQAKSKVKGLGGAIGGLRGKTVKVGEAGADQSRGRVRGLGGAIGGLRGKTVKVSVEYAQAVAAIAQITTQLALVQSKTITITTNRVSTGEGKASGGLIDGPGTSTSDSIPIWASAGEYMQPASAVSHYGLSFMEAVRSRRFPKQPGFANGGKVSKDAAKEIRQAKAEAARQARLAAKVDKRNLGQAAQDFLSGMSSTAALAALGGMSNKQIRKSAQKSGALGRLQTRRQNEADARTAFQGLDADRVARRFALLSPTERKAEINTKITQNANAIALAKGAEKVRLIEKQRDLEQQLVDATEAEKQAAEEAAAAQAAKEDEQLDKVNQLRDAVDGLAGGYRSFASISTTAVNDVTEAQSKLTDANDAVAAAQKKMDLAGSDRERAAAAAELAKAMRDQQSAQQGVNDAGKPSTGSIRGNMAAKLAKLKGFGEAVKQLKANGLNPTTLSDILSMGPEQGYDFAKALLDGGLADINDLQNQITQESASLGYFQYGQNAASDSMTGYAAAQAAGLVTGGIVMAPAPVTVSIDGNAIAQALISYKRQNGGSTPGLNL